MSELKRVGDALAGVLVSHQRATLEHEGDRVWFNLDNTKTLRGIRIGPCLGCEQCTVEGAQHLEFTPYALERKP